MARLNVKPTRMELATLKDRLQLSTRGHKLLKDKQDELMRRFITLIKKNNQLRDEVEAELIDSMQEFVVAKSLINESFIEELFVGTETNVELNIHEKNIMSVIVPEMNFDIKEAEVSSDIQYGYLNSSSEMDEAIERIETVMPKLLELSEIEKNFSNREQSSITADEETQLALLKGNIAYEKKYGHIFLIKASGLSSEDVLQALKYRLVNDPEIEKRIVHNQLTEIALLRLSQELQP